MLMLYNFLLCVLLLCIDFCFLDQCLVEKENVSWVRQFHVSNKTLTILIDVSNRTSHHLISIILKILLTEQLRYKSVKFNFIPSLPTSKILSRLNWKKEFQAHINAEVWQPPGFNVESLVNKGLVMDCGPLGPIARRGVFTFSDHVERIYKEKSISVDHWRFFQPPYDFWNYNILYKFLTEDNHWKPISNVTTANFGHVPIILIDKPEYKNILLGIFSKLYSKSQAPLLMIRNSNRSLQQTLDLWYAKISAMKFKNDDITTSTNKSVPSLLYKVGPLFFYHWYPSTVTVQRNYSRVLFPDCYEDANMSLCDFELNQLSKMTSVVLKTHAVLAYNLVSSFRLSNKELVKMLKQVKSTNGYDDKKLYDIACEWVNKNRNIWKNWTAGWNKKQKLVIPALFALYGKWVPEKMVEASLDTINRINEESFNNFPYKLVLDVRNVSCNEETVLREYLTYSSRAKNNNSAIILSYLIGVCSDSLESTLKLTTFNKHITVTSTADSPKFGNSNKYKYFFRTIPSMKLLMDVLISAFVEWNWKRIVVLRKDSMFVDSKYLKDRNIDVIEDFVVKDYQLTFQKVYEFLKKMRDQKKGKIFLVEYFSGATREIMCAASKLQMTLDNGYVWFLNPWMSPGWCQVGTKNCTAQEIMNVTKKYLVITHKGLSIPDLRTSNKLLDKKRINNTYLDYPFAIFTIQAIKKIAETTKRLLMENPCALSIIESPNVTRRFIQLISGYDKEDKRSSLIEKGKWFLQARCEGITWTIFRWSTRYDEYGNITLSEKYLSPFGQEARATFWGRNNKFTQPSDGSEPLNYSDCEVEWLRAYIGLTCSGTIFLCCSVGALVIIIISIICTIIFFHKLQKTHEEERARKPFEFICEELAHLDLSGSDVVINRIVGKGNFGTVYGGEARQEGRWVLVAIKAISKSKDYQYKYDFLAEAKLMSGLNHENVVKLIGICLNPGNDMIYLIMEHVTGGDLKKFLIKRRVKAKEDPDNEKISPLRLTKYARDIACGLSYLHRNLYLHRDIACRNCLIDPDFGIKLGDFGLAKKMKCDRKGGSWYYRFAGLGAMPIRWLPPESLQFGNYSVYSDIWSYGVTLYEIVTFGNFPFGGSEHAEVVDKVKRGQFTVAKCLPQSFHNELVYSIIEKCCSYHPQNRYSSMDEIIEIFDQSPSCVKPSLTDDPPNSLSQELSISTNMGTTTEPIVASNRRPQYSRSSSSCYTVASSAALAKSHLSYPGSAIQSQPVSYCKVMPVNGAGDGSGGSNSNSSSTIAVTSNNKAIISGIDESNNDKFLQSFFGIDSINEQPITPSHPNFNAPFSSNMPLKVKSPSIEYIALPSQLTSQQQNQQPVLDSDLGYVTYKTDQNSGTPTHCQENPTCNAPLSTNSSNNVNNYSCSNNYITATITKQSPSLKDCFQRLESSQSINSNSDVNDLCKKDKNYSDSNCNIMAKPILTNQPCSLDLSIDAGCSDIDSNTPTTDNQKISLPEMTFACVTNQGTSNIASGDNNQSTFTESSF